MNTPDIRQAALSLLKSRTAGVLATVSPEGTPHARTIYYSSDDNFEIFFMTLTNTRKADDVRNEKQVAFVVSDEEGPKTIQVEGIITELTDTAVIDPIIVDLLNTFMTNGEPTAPIAHLHASPVSYFKITPTWVRYGDFSHGQGEENVFSVITP